MRKFSAIGAVYIGMAIYFLSFSDPAKAQQWRQYADPEKAGWSVTELENARNYASEIGSGAVLIIDRGNVVAAWGNIEFPYKSASIRKSIYDATIGAAYRQKPFDLNTTLGELKIDDLETLSDGEKKATFENLLTARSGVYHPAAYETRSNAMRRPERFSAAPGTKWYYNNWDFNVVCPAFRRLSGQSMEEAFKERLAVPLGMEDFRSEHVFEWLEPRVSRHPALTFRMSARDLARIGQLYLNGGKWNGKQIVSPGWIKRSTSSITEFEEEHYRGVGNGYGRLWWTYPARPEEENPPFEAYRRVAARGAGGQFMVLIPDLDLLIVHLADTDSGPGVGDQQVYQLMNKILAAKKGRVSGKSKLGPVRVKALSEKEPEPLRRDFKTVSAGSRRALEGRYMFNEKTGIRFYQFEDRLFLQPVGMPFPDAEVFEVADGSLRSPLVDFIVRPVRNGKETVETVEMTFLGETRTGRRME
ncbi:MAG: serine hydrolase [Pyrinomonadaceae bacterium]